MMRNQHQVFLTKLPVGSNIYRQVFKRFSFFKNFLRKLFRNLFGNLLRNLSNFYKFQSKSHINISQLKNMKKTISQTLQSNNLKSPQNDYTNVSTENSSQHSLDSSFQEKQSARHSQVQGVFEEEENVTSENTRMEDQAQAQQKETKIQFYKKSVEWLGKKYKRFKIKIQTLYIAVSYLIKYISIAEEMKHKHEILSAVCLLLASKINQIHFPSIKSIIGSLDFTTTKRQILQVEQYLLEMFNFQMNVERNSYSIVYQFIKLEEEEKRKNAQKLLFLAVTNPQNLQFGESYLGLSIVYLLKPEALKDNLTINRDKMKKIAFIVYKMYKEKKNQYAYRKN